MNATGPLGLFAAPGFFRLWLIGLLTGIARWLEMLAIGVYVYDITGSALQVALFAIAPDPGTTTAASGCESPHTLAAIVGLDDVGPL